MGCLDTFGTLSEHCLIHSLDPCITGVEADAGSRNSACVELKTVRLSDSLTRTCWRSGMYTTSALRELMFGEFRSQTRILGLLPVPLTG